MVKRTGSVQICFLVPEELLARLKALSERTRIPQAAYFREALEQVIEKHDTPPPRPPKAKR